MKADWKPIVESFMERSHCATIHPELVDVLAGFADGYAAPPLRHHGQAVGRVAAQSFSRG